MSAWQMSYPRAQVQESGQAAWFQIDLGEERLVSGIQVTNSWSETSYFHKGVPLRMVPKLSGL